jgi:hypothetical protein
VCIVGYIWQHLDRDQVDTPELCSNMHDLTKLFHTSTLRRHDTPVCAVHNGLADDAGAVPELRDGRYVPHIKDRLGDGTD